MSDLTPLRIGERVTGIAGQTMNALIAGELRDRRKLSALDDTRTPKQKLPVVVSLVWAGSDKVEPGDVVKLVDVLFTYEEEESAPFSGLQFNADVFAGEYDAPFAIALGPIDPAVTGEGDVVVENSIGYGFIPDAYWARVAVSDAGHEFAHIPTSGKLLASNATNGQRIIWKPTGTGTKWCVVAIERERGRLIRGQSYGVQSGSTVLLDGVVPLAGGFDPTNGDGSAQVTVTNVFGNVYADNEYVDAVWSPGSTADWETLKTSSGSEKYRLIRGKAFGNVDGDDETFNIDNIVVLAGGLDPRSVASDATEQLEIENAPGETFFDGEIVVAIYREIDATWEVLAVERFRQCKGDYYSTTDSTHIIIENVEPLGSGLTPLTDESGRLTVVKQAMQSYTSGDVVACDFNDPTEEWEARPKSDSKSYRLICGIAYTAATPIATDDGTFLIDHVEVLAGGLDPRTTPGDATEKITVRNTQHEAIPTGAKVTAIYNDSAIVPEWQLLYVERFRSVRGIVIDSIDPADVTFTIDTLIALGSGLDPRSDPDDNAETLTVQNLSSQRWGAGEQCYADFDALLKVWIARKDNTFRALRGKCSSSVLTSDGTFNVDHIVVLDSGTDPRDDPTSTSETVEITNTPTAEAHESGDDIWADYNAKDNVWEARPKSGGGGDTIIVEITSTISGRVTTARGSGSAQQVAGDLTTAIGSSFTLYNLSLLDYVGTSGDPLFTTATKIGADYYLDTFDLTSVSGYATGNLQSVGHDPAQLPLWQDDGTC